MNINLIKRDFMDYKEILKEIKPTIAEREKVHKIANEAIDYINKKSLEENINAEAILVGSVAKDTWLSGKADIDIFINFPLEKSEDYLKEKGLYLGYECIEHLNGIAKKHYASHPYLTSHINNYDIDFVPCYKIANASQLKSAVDRTLLHTKYMKKHLSQNQKDEVLVLKKFMIEVGTYGSEFKVGGFAGYLCEMLILEYGNFENTLKEASLWKNKTVIDLENYGTSKLFNDSLIAIDPTDENRNVAAALRTGKMAEFIIASRNFLSDENLSDENKKIDYFHEVNKKIDLNEIILGFRDRKTKVITVKFNIPDVPVDTLHPQLKKTQISIEEKLEENDFSVFKSDYWTDEDKIAIFIFELNVHIQSKYRIHEGPKIWDKLASTNFLNSHKGISYILGDTLVLNKKREFETAEELIKFVLTHENIPIIKVGKNLKDLIVNSYELNDLEDLLNKDTYLNDSSKPSYFNDFLKFLDDFLNPGRLLKR